MVSLQSSGHAQLKDRKVRYQSPKITQIACVGLSMNM